MDWGVTSALAQRHQERGLNGRKNTKKWGLELRNDKSKWLMLDLHLGEETRHLRNKVKVILEQICFEHCREVLRNLLTLLSS